jgi:hypothetical protein
MFFRRLGYSTRHFSNHFNRHFIKKSKFNSFSNPQQQKRNASNASNLTRQYGPVAVIVYSSLAFPTFLGCLYSITYMGVTQKDIYNWLDRVKSFFGLEVTSAQDKTQVSRNWESLPDFMKTEKFTEFATNVLLAMVMTKIFAPLKLTLTAMLTPSAARLFQRFGWFLPKKG